MSVLLSLASRAGDFQSPNQRKKLQEHGFPRTNMRQVTRFGLRVARSVDFMFEVAFIYLFGRGLHIFFRQGSGLNLLLLVGA